MKSFRNVALLGLGAALVLGGLFLLAKESQPSPDVSNLEYFNSDYGFALAMPESWEGYRANYHEYGDSGDYHADICFWFGEPHQPFCVFQIVISTKEQWARSSRKTSPIFQDDRYVFGLDGDYDNVSSSNCLQLDEFQCAKRGEVLDIFKSFKFVK